MANLQAGTYELKPLPDNSDTSRPGSSPLPASPPGSPPPLDSPHAEALPLIPTTQYEAGPEGPPKNEPSLAGSTPTDLEIATKGKMNISAFDRLMQRVEIVQELVLPFVAVAYLAFCFAAHATVIPLKSGLIDVSPSNLETIKSGLTSINIILITIGLFPVQSLMTDLKSEEFFRAVSAKATGVPLRSVNKISNPSFGVIESVIVIFGRYCSPYFFTAFVAGWLIYATSTLAPAALSVSTALFDDELFALPVGAIPPDAFLNISLLGEPIMNGSITDNLLSTASSLAWAESQLHVTYSFDNTYGPTYIVPIPIGLPPNVPARWLSDVIIMDPKCEWGKPVLVDYGDIGRFGALALRVHLQEQGLNITLYDGTVFFDDIVLEPIDYRQILSLSGKGYTTSGVTVWIFSRCVNGENCHGRFNVNLDLSGISTFQVTDKVVPTNQANQSQTFPPYINDVAFLVCSPNATIETREVRNDGHGRLTVLNKTYPMRQGNLNNVQTHVMLSYALANIKTDAGPTAGTRQLGSITQAALFFDQDILNLPFSPGFENISDAPSAKPLPVENITARYTQTLHSASKAFLSGAISTSYVPARLSTELIVFTASLPQVIVSTVLFIMLCAVHVVARLRKSVPQFTLFSVAASLDGSDVPRVMGQIRSDASSDAKETEIMATIGGKLLVATSGENGSVLHIP